MTFSALTCPFSEKFLAIDSHFGSPPRARCSISGVPSDFCLDVDFFPPRSNNPHMARPDAVRRIKTYSAADGCVYQYYFFEGNRAQRASGPGGEFTYIISADRQSNFAFKVFVLQSTLEAWARQNGRSLSSSEEYAVAKMRLFQAFDEGVVQPSPDGHPPREVSVDVSNLEELLAQLGI